MRTWNKTKNKIIVTEEDTVTRRKLVQVNIFNVYVVEGIVTIINAGYNEFNKSNCQI